MKEYKILEYWDFEGKSQCFH